MFYRLIFFVILYVPNFIFAQYKVSGNLTDTTKSAGFDNSLVYLTDTNQILKKFVRTNNSGNFNFTNLQNGNYFLVAIKDGYSDLKVPVFLNNEDLNMGNLTMFNMIEVMKTIYIKAKRDAIRMKGDTLEYAADSFKTFEGAVVEDLLKRLPGVQVDRNGQITAQGKKVERVLVDGEEFFGNDAQMATTNIDAKSVDAVQVYEAQTDEAKASNSGETVQVMDIKLKEEAKRGYIGKITAGAGAGEPKDAILEGKAMLSVFGPKTKIGAVLMGGNSPNLQLSWEERNAFSNDLNSYTVDENGNYFEYGDEFSYNSGYSQGLPELYSMAGFINQNLKKDKININASVNYKTQNVDIENTINTRQIVNSTFLDQFKEIKNNNSRDLADLKFKTEFKLDSLSELEVGFNVENKNGVKNETTSNNTKNEELIELNNLSSQGKVKNTTLSSGIFASYRKNFKKERQYFNINVNLNRVNSNSNDNITNRIGILKVNNIEVTNWELEKESKNKNNSLGVNAVFYKPLSKKVQLRFKTDLDYDLNNNSSLTYMNKEVLFTDSLSAKFEYVTFKLSNSIGLYIERKKINIGIGALHKNIVFEQKEDIRNIKLRSKPFNFITPYLNISYFPNKNDQYRFRYSNDINPPNLNQIQPIITNIMPIIQLQGNTNLKNEITHNFSFNSNLHRTFSNLYIYTNANFYVKENSIKTNLQINENGTGINSYINTQGNFGVSYYASVYKKFSKIPISLNLGFNGNNNQGVSILNNNKNIENNNSTSLNSGIGLEMEQIYLGLSHSFISNSSKYSLNKEFSNKFQNQKWNFYFNYSNPKLFKFNIDFDYVIMPKSANFNQSTNTLLCNVNISRFITKNKKLALELGVYDLFNKNRGYNRSVLGSIIQDTRFNTFTQFFYGKLALRFKGPKLKTDKKEEIIDDEE